MVECDKDDLAGCCGKCKPKTLKVVAVIPVHGRLPLLRFTIERLLKKNGVAHVVCVGDNNFDRRLCESVGAEWVQYRNKPLGDKWNAGFRAAKKHSPDACLFVGSSDWLSDNWIPEMQPYLKDNDLIGTAGCNFLHIGHSDFKACYWPGYTGRRKGESIGIGRLISSRVLDRIHWCPFNPDLDRSLDYSMVENVTQVAGHIHLVDNPKIKSVSISTDRWQNKHKFFDHYHGLYPSEIIDEVDSWIVENFPEAKQVFKPVHV